MPKHISDDLANAAFGELAGKHNDLTSSMSRVLIARDENAPMYISQDDEDSFEKRRDIRTLRKLYAKAYVHDRAMVYTIYHRIEYILFRLHALKLAELRSKYFEYADRMRAEGKQIRYPDDSCTKCVQPTRGNSDWQTARCIGILLPQKDIGHDVVILKLIGYLTKRSIEETFPEAKLSSPAKETFQCFLCHGRYMKKFNLNRHFATDHLKKLKNGFSCPECLQSGIINPVNAGPEAWCSHVARFHGQKNAPNLKLQLKVEDNTHMKEICTGKRKRLTSPESLHEPSKKLRCDPDQKQSILLEKKEEISCIKKGEKEEAFDFGYLLEEERSTHDPHNGEEFYVSGRDDLDE